MGKENSPLLNYVDRGKVLPVCSICSKVPSGGIRDGIRLNKAFICTSCEQQIAHSDIDSDSYQLLVDKIRRILI